MIKRYIDYSIYLVTDDHCLQGRDLFECVEQALQGGVTLVQYRAKEKDASEMYHEALDLRRLCDRYNVPMIVNDRLELAVAVGAAGVHIGQNDTPCQQARAYLGDDFIIGVSAHTVEEALQAVKDGADYLGCGAVFGTQTKKNVDKMGLETLREICAKVKIPVVGIGGIHANNYLEVLDAGADGAAMVKGILGQDDILSVVKYIESLKFIYDSAD